LTPDSPPAAVNYRELMKKVEQVVAGLARSQETGRTVNTVAEAIIGKFRDELGIFGCRIYRRQGPTLATLGAGEPPGFELPATYGPIAVLSRAGVHGC
jgi:hypothetical protein